MRRLVPYVLIALAAGVIGFASTQGAAPPQEHSPTRADYAYVEGAIRAAEQNAADRDLLNRTVLFNTVIANNQAAAWYAEAARQEAARIEADNARRVTTKPSRSRTAGNGGCNPASIVQAESKGDIHARNPSGAAGKYQFIPSTWDGYGGYASAADAPEAVQDAKFNEVWAGGAGASHWRASVC